MNLFHVIAIDLKARAKPTNGEIIILLVYLCLIESCSLIGFIKTLSN